MITAKLCTTALQHWDIIANAKYSWWRHQMDTFSALLTLCEGNPPVTGGFPLTKAIAAELWYFLWSAPRQTVQQTIETLVICDAIALIMTSLWGCGQWLETPWRACNNTVMFSGILIKIRQFSLKKMTWKIASTKMPYILYKVSRECKCIVYLFISTKYAYNSSFCISFAVFVELLSCLDLK